MSSFRSAFLLLVAIALVNFLLGCGGITSQTASSSGPGGNTSGGSNSGGTSGGNSGGGTSGGNTGGSTSGGGSSGSASTTGAVVTWHYNDARTGLNDHETVLNVNSVSSGFAKKYSYPIDGESFAQPLYVPDLTINGAKHNVVFFATEHDTVYAYDADKSGDPLWKKSLLVPNSTPVPNINVNDPQGRTAVGSEVGITGTPVIDLSTNTMYVSAMSWENGTAVHRLHALDITTGDEKFGGPVIETATVDGTGLGSANGKITFDPVHQNQRPGLVLSNGLVYVSWGSFSDVEPYHGWIMAFDSQTLQQKAAINLSPNSEGAAVWQAGGAPAVDGNGYLYVATADGHNMGVEGGPDFGDSMLKLKAGNGTFDIADWFTPNNEHCLDRNDMDFGSSTPMLLPDGASTVPLVAVGDKEGRLYLINGSHLGNFMPDTDNVVQEILFSPTACDLNVPTQYDTRRMYGATAFWNNTLYAGMAHGNLVAYKLSGGQLVSASQSSDSFSDRGPIPVVSSNGNTDGIVWIAEYNSSTHHTTLRAYDATDLGRVLFAQDVDWGEAFTVPLVINGKVYVAREGSIAVFGPQ